MQAPLGRDGTLTLVVFAAFRAVFAGGEMARVLHAQTKKLVQLIENAPNMMADDAVLSEPLSEPNSLLTGKDTGNFVDFGLSNLAFIV